MKQMALSTSTGWNSTENSQLSLRTSGNEQDLSLESEGRYDFRESTKEKRKYSPIVSESNNIGHGFEVYPMQNYPGSNTGSRTSLNHSMDDSSPISKFVCDHSSTTVRSTSTPTGCGTKRKNSSADSNSQEKRRKILSTSAQGIPGNLSFRPGLRNRRTAGKNTSWSQQHTVVQPFNFMTDRRLKNTQPKKCDKEVDFVSSLRSCSQRLDQFKPEITRPKPFSFDVARKQAPKQEIADKKSEASKQKPHLVIPRSPNLHAVTRHRPVTVLSREQIEEMEVEEMKKWKFHAKPVDPNLFARVGITKVEPKPTTKPEGLQLETEKRFQKKAKPVDETQKYEFHAQPVPKNILKEPTGLKKMVKIPLTEPKSPHFSLRTRTYKSKENSLIEVPIVKHKILKKPPRFNKCPPAVPEKLSTTFEKRCTEIQPFSFEERDRMRFEKKKAKIEEVLEKEKMIPKFKANPMPIPGNSPCGLPTVQKKSPTKPEPFKLRAEHVVERRAQKLKQVENELSMQIKGGAFKAKPAAVVHKQAFQPQKSTKPLTTFNGFQLHTEKRAAEWHEMEEVTKARNAEYEAICEHLNKEKEEKEKEELHLLRQQAVHKANPVRHYKPIVVQHSNKPLTEPLSPQFATGKRIQRI